MGASNIDARSQRRLEHVGPPIVCTCWKKRPALKKTLLIVDTLAVLQDEMSALKAVASPNICFIVVADAVFHAPMSAAKAAAWLNISTKSVTAAVSHEPMG